MKIRTGFVSNSSSSSFVLVGLKFKSDLLSEEQENEIMNNSKYMLLSGSDDGIPGGYTLIGNMISSSDYGMDYDELPLDKIQKIIEQIEKETGLKGTPGIFTGTRMC